LVTSRAIGLTGEAGKRLGIALGSGRFGGDGCGRGTAATLARQNDQQHEDDAHDESKYRIRWHYQPLHGSGLRADHTPVWSQVEFAARKLYTTAHYQGRSGQGIRRWPLFLSLGQMILKFIATGVLAVPLPKLHWAWYTCENTVGQVRRRLIESCHPHISRAKVDGATKQKWAKAA
jgi:hypothetical protein